MNAEWQARVREAQRMTALRLASEEGPHVLHRVRCGEEGSRPQPIEGSCWDCAAAPGQYHVPPCDQEECPACMGQLLSCAASGCAWGAAELVAVGLAHDDDVVVDGGGDP